MGIELRITSSATEAESTTSTKHINEIDITIGCYNDDSVKLDSKLLQGSHVRISREWNSDTDQQRLIITNISGNTSIFINNEALESDEYREINERSVIRLGGYSITARDTSLSYFTTTKSTTSDFALENFSPNEFSLDTAMQSLLQQPSEDVATTEDTALMAGSEAPTPSIVDTDEKDTITKSASEESPSTLAKTPPAVETKPQNDVVSTEIPTLNMTKSLEQSTESNNVVAISNEAISDKQARELTIESTDKQTLFEGVVGNEDIVELNFDAYRLYSIRGRIMHHNQALAGVVLDGGPLGVTHTNANGYYGFENIVEGTNYQINISCNGYTMAKTQVLFGTINENIEYNCDAIKLSRVAGRIIHEGAPLPGVTLDAGPYGICLTDANGQYHFDNVPENTDLAIQALGAGFMFKRISSGATNQRPAATPTPTGNVVPAVTSAASDYTDQQMEDSLAALVGHRQNVA